MARGCTLTLLKNVLYLHGFASSPRGRKVEALRELLAPAGLRVVAPDLNIPSFQKLDFKGMSRMAFWEAKKHMPAVIVGSSLGAMVALDVARIAPAPALVLIAPAIAFGARWTEKLPAGESVPFFHHGEGRELPIHRRFFEQMAALDVDSRPPSMPVTIVMGENDESVPFEGVRAAWESWERSGGLAPRSRFVAIPGGDHGLVDHVERIRDEVLASAAVK
ncbi:MAG TPA: YqiA/YcfP family alpha/beta fold hydrolase [Thermoanaerobaculia bacterium]|nr:YqiA/YcfP family alpha/beta fold hydrolase [Thermoanaerobaculia bacterium]